MNKWLRIGGSAVLAFSLLSVPFMDAAAVEAKGRTSMSYISFINKDQYNYYIDRTHNSLNVVTPNYFSLNSDGTLKINTAFIDPSFINEMHNEGVRVVPFIQNAWGDGTALTNRDALSQQIANAIATYNLDGVNVDLEGLNETHRDSYTDFMKKLRILIPKQKQVSIAVAANPYNWTTGWHGSYDYKKLSDALTGPNDYLMVMAYDESWRGGPEGPVASLSFVEDTIKYTLNKQVPAEKIVLGIPFYGRIWGNNTSFNGIGVSHHQINAIMDQYKATAKVTFDSTSQTPKLTFTMKSGDPTYRIAGKDLIPGTYTIWFDNEKSLKKKLILVQKYNLRGTGSWSLSQEDPQMWNYYNLWLNADYFKDVIDHWAQGDIYAVNVRDWMIGVSANEFSPDGTLTRAMGATLLVRAMGYEQATTTTPFPFKDVPSDHWAKKYIHIAKEKGLINGTSSTTFEPDEPLTREQAAQMLNNLLQYPNASLPAQSPFKDVKPSQWSYQAIINMNKNNIIDGYTDGTFQPKKNVSRAEMAKLMNVSIDRIDELVN